MRLVKKLTIESARDQMFEVEGQTMTVAEYFQNQLNIQLQFPDAICVEICTTPLTPILFPCVSSRPAALYGRHHPPGAVRGSTGSVRS
jgi:hypothetical protein